MINSSMEKLIAEGHTAISKELQKNISNLPVANGGTHELFDMEDRPDIVVKALKMKPEIFMPHRSSGREEGIARLKEEHAYVASFLPGFVPRTLFVEGDLGGGEELFMIQERVTGEDYFMLTYYGYTQEVSEELKKNVTEFLERYYRMRLAGRVIEDQVMIDFDKGTIKAYDTNVLKDQQNTFKIRELAMALNDNVLPTNAEEAIDFLIRNFKCAENLKSLSEKEFLEGLHIPGKMYLAILDECEQRGIDWKANNQILLIEIQHICGGLAYFPPKKFQDNIFTLQLQQLLKLI